MVDLEKERKAFEEQWRLLGGHLLYVEWSTDNMYSLSPAAKVLNKNDQISLFNTINTAWGLWVVQAKQNKTEIDSLKAENAALKERLQKIEDGEFVVVPKSEIGNYYFDDSECIYIDEPDSFLSELDVGEVCEVKRRDYFDLPTQYAAKVFIDIDNIEWRLFESELEAEIAANECKDKFWGEQGDGDE
ncbi:MULTISPECIES: hypothetical protein [Acinetobacter]|uniref:Uncharacterized protein n=2 Tax=Acinetobacter TaxID=469 RepID=N9DAF5_9GAMM|nr:MULTISPECIES: hypothetical protein [Acinetobacter]ENV79589.1 hypothetical protein F942_01779 [Acinetobacter ursingii ANC 3649]QXZ23200.1 hypothetical protein I6L31_16290 [Acinetobacter septicus]QXZ23247.1 hypothetical protein I6L31_00080 [Acinetobacter septicus]